VVVVEKRRTGHMAPATFATKTLPIGVDVIAPDGSEIRELLMLKGGSMAHCALPEGAVSVAVRHRTVEEIWYVLQGRGEVWRSQQKHQETVAVGPGTCLTIPHGTAFQFRALGPGPLVFVLVTMPPWPGNDEAVPAPSSAPWQARPSGAGRRSTDD
jgi:mannose-6-phosphate isomerase-like protein (cupin superfamily)